MEVKRVKIEDDEAQAKFVARAHELLPWLDGPKTIQQLLKKEEALCMRDKMYTSEFLEPLWEKFAKGRVWECSLHRELEYFYFLNVRAPNAIAVKITNMALEEFVEWEKKVKEADEAKEAE